MLSRVIGFLFVIFSSFSNCLVIFSSFSNVGGILRAQDFSSCCCGSCTLLLWTLKELALSEHAVGAVSFCRP